MRFGLAQKIQVPGIVALFLAVISYSAAQAQVRSLGEMYPVPTGITPPGYTHLTRNKPADTFDSASGRKSRPAPFAAATADSFFLPVATFATAGIGATSVAIFDANGDSIPDLVVANACGSELPDGTCAGGTVSVLLGNGDGTFQAATTYPTGGFSSFNVIAADANGDGKTDLIVSNACGGDVSCNGTKTMSVLLGKGDGTFQPALISNVSTLSSQSLAVGDLNGDGYLDAVTLLCGPNCFAGTGKVAVQFGKGNGQFKAPVLYSSGGQDPVSVSVADLNHDGHLDIVVANCSLETGQDPCPGTGGLAILMGKGNGTFAAPVTYDTAVETPRALTVGDVNGDGIPDIVVSAEQCAVCSNQGGISILLGKGDGTFQPAVTFASGALDANAVQLADLNGDGKLDLLVSNTQVSYGAVHSAVSVLLGNGDGTFQSPSVYDPGGFTSDAVAAADVNNDHKMDAVVVDDCSSQTTCSSGSLVGVLLNNLPPHSPTTVDLTPSLNPVGLRKNAIYTANVHSGYPGPVRGTVTFAEGKVILQTSKYVGTDVSYTAAYNSIGSHSITTTYSGDADSAGSVSPTLVEYVAGPSFVGLISSLNPSFVGQAVTFTAHVSSNYGSIPDGEPVTFLDGAVALASVPLSGGTATFTTTFSAARAHVIEAAYAGDHQFLPSTQRISQLVQKYSTTTALSSSPNPSSVGQSVTFTARVTSAGLLPTGKLKFLDGSTLLAVVSLNGGVATLTKSNLAKGTHPITAQYVGDTDTNASMSVIVNQVVN
jgi:hypothetical protein